MILKTATLTLLFLVLLGFTLPTLDHQTFGQEPEESKSAQKSHPNQKSKPDADASKPDVQDPDPEKPAVVGVTFSSPVKVKWKVTARIVGGSGTAKNMLVTLPVPTDWPEQTVATVEEDIPPQIENVTYRQLESGVQQLMLGITTIRPREEINISMTFLVSTSQVNPPPDTTVFVKPKSNNRDAKPYLGVSPQINYRNSKLRRQVKELVADKETVWEEVESIFDWVRDNIKDTTEPPQDVQQVFKDKAGCNEDKVGLFVAMCRAHKVPARIVWVDGTQYAEFMLVDADENLHWFPCKVGGIREFGGVAEPLIVLQKGDSIRVPEKDARQKFVSEFAICTGKSKPSVRFARQLLPAE